RVGNLDASNYEASVAIACTDEHGAFTCAALRTGRVLVQLDRGTTVGTTIEPGRRRELDCSVAGVDVRGRVRDFDGRPFAGAGIYLVCNPADHAGHVVAHSAADGSFAVRGVPPDAARLSALAPDRAPTPQRVIAVENGVAVGIDLQFAAR